MSLSHFDAGDRLEAYVLGALPDHEAAAVTEHLARCAACRATAEAFVEVAAGLAESVPTRAPRPALRERILAAAHAERRGRLASGIAAALRRPALALARLSRALWLARDAKSKSLALVVALVILLAGAGVLVAQGQRELQALREERDRAVALAERVGDERDEYRAIVERMSQGGRWWYMVGAEQFAGSGGTLVAPNRDGRAFVLFHDLRTLASPQRYVIWLIKQDGAWVRAADFAPTGDALQRVDLALQIADFVQCAVTLETSATGRRAGPLVMQSRIFQP